MSVSKDREMTIRIRDAIGACRIDPTHGHEFTVKFPEEDGGGIFKIKIENAEPTKGS